MSRILTDKETKAILKSLMEIWQESQDEHIGLNLGLALLCRVEVGEKMDALLNGVDNYEYHLHETDWFDENMAEMLSAYHNKQAQEQAREQQIQDAVEKMKVKDCGNGLLEVDFDNE